MELHDQATAAGKSVALIVRSALRAGRAGRSMAALSPAESLFLLKPNRTPARETVKVTLLSLLAQGLVRLEEQVTKRFIGTRKTVYVRLTHCPVPALPAPAVSLLDQVRAAQADTGSMPDVVRRARQAY
jgi:hypothetical protein